jgi:hypothetical protein
MTTDIDTSAEAVERMIDLLRLPFGAASVFRDLLAERDRLRAALQDISRQPDGDEESAQAVARAALKETGQ